MTKWVAYDRFVKSLSRCFFIIAGISMASVLIISVIDILGNKFFKYPLPGGIDIVGLVAVFSIAFAIAEVQVAHGHIEVEILEEHLPKKARKINAIFISILGIILWGIITGFSFKYAVDLYVVGEVSMTLPIPLWPWVFIQGICSIAVVLVLILQTVNLVRQVN